MDNLTDEQFAEMVEAQCSPARKRIENLERENARLQMELDASCNAEELRQVRAENTKLRECGKALRDALAFECHKIGDAPREIDAWDALVSPLPNESRPDEWTTNCMRYKLYAEIEAENGRIRKALTKLASWGPDCLPDVCSKEQVDEYNRDHAAALAVLDGVDKRSTESQGQSDWLDKAGPLSIYTEIKLPLSDS